ncbi:MAG TPA: glycosyltransferase family 39 protein, partial [Vicinamibacterales bacterium]|nr:glycosyltransferase family 39 protein [Vicinamibacterales bacterium]
MQASSVRARLPPRYLFPTILLIAVAVRVWGLGFGLPYIVARPDETEMAGPAVGFLSGDLRPPFFEWPTLFTYTTAFLYVLYFLVTRPFNAYATLAQFAESRRQNLAPFLYVTRSLSALMGAATVWGVYAICRRVFDETVGIVAALFLALAFLHVRDSHFGVTDVAMTGLVVLA